MFIQCVLYINTNSDFSIVVSNSVFLLLFFLPPFLFDRLSAGPTPSSMYVYLSVCPSVCLCRGTMAAGLGALFPSDERVTLSFSPEEVTAHQPVFVFAYHCNYKKVAV